MGWLRAIANVTAAERLWSLLVLITVGFVLNIGFQNCAPPPQLDLYDSADSASAKCVTGDPGCASVAGATGFAGGRRICSLVPSTTVVGGGQLYNYRLAASPALVGAPESYSYRWYPSGTLSPTLSNGAVRDANLKSTAPLIWEFLNRGVIGDAVATESWFMIVFDSAGKPVCDTRGLSPATNPIFAQVSLLNPTCSLRFEPLYSYIPLYPSSTPYEERAAKDLRLIVELSANQIDLPVDLGGYYIDINGAQASGDIPREALVERSATKAVFQFSREGSWHNFVTKGFSVKIKLKTTAGATICTTNQRDYVLQMAN